MNPHVWIVNEFTDVTDSVWNDRDLAVDRAAELDRKNGCEDFSPNP